MFKKTINELKDLKETSHEVVVKIDDESTKKIAKTIIKAVAAIAVVNVVAHAAITVIDSQARKSEKSED